jgi:hypothetical protein
VDRSGAVINVTLHADCVRRRFLQPNVDAVAGAAPMTSDRVIGQPPPGSAERLQRGFGFG